MLKPPSTSHVGVASVWVQALVCGVGLTALALVFFGHFMFGRLPVSTDMSLMYAPFYSLKWDGGVPLWNPHLAGGMSMAGNLQFSAWYPPRWPFYFIADWRSYFSLFMFLHYLIAMLGSWGAMRAMGFSLAARVAGTVLFACGGYMVGKIINTTIFLASCWFPWLVWGAVGRDWRGGFPAMIGMAMIILTGSPHLMIYGSIGFCAAWGVLALAPGAPEASEGRQDAASRPRVAWHPWAGYVGGTILGVPALIPGIQQAETSIRTLTNTANNLADSLLWSEIPFSLLGGLGGNAIPEINDKCVYMGGAGLWLVVVGSLHAAHWRDRRWLCGCALTVTGWVLALGKSVGWQHVMPWIPGLNLLEGPARALVLVALGLALLCALGIEAVPRMSRARIFLSVAVTIPMLTAVSHMGGWSGSFRLAGTWLTATPALFGPEFAVMDSWPTFAGAALIAGLWPRGNRGLDWALTGLLALQLWHFSPRVAPRTVRPEYFDPPPNVRFLMEQPGRDAFRIAAMDPLQTHDVEWDNVHKFKFLMPNLATLYGLNDIRGFDPLIPLDYYNDFRAEAGSAPYNDPIRNLELGWPSEDLFERLNVRYYIGHPCDRRLPHEPILLAAGRETIEASPETGLHLSAPVEAWHFVSLVEHKPGVRHGEAIAELEIIGDEGAFRFPIRLGIETANVFAGDTVTESRDFHVNLRWPVHTRALKSGHTIFRQNYRALVRFPHPLHVRTVRWKLLKPDALIYIAAEACRLDSALMEKRWRLAFDDPVAPVYEFLGAGETRLDSGDDPNPVPPTHN